MRDPTPTVAARGTTADLAFTLAVAVVALLPRLFVAIAWAREPVWDGHYYHFGAERIAQGLGYSEDMLIGGYAVWKPWCHYPVGYSGLLAGLYRLFGSGLLVAPVANAMLGTLLVVVIHRLARYYLSENRARIAAGVAALHPGLIAYSVVVMSELLAALLITSALWLAVRWQGRWWGVVLAGVTVGLATLVRPPAVLVAPLLVLLLPGSIKGRLLRAGAAAALAVLVVTPWTLRNCKVMDGCAFVSTNGGWNLAIGALTETGRFHTLRASDGCRVVTGQVQQDRCWRRIGRELIQRDPVRWLAKIPKKLGQTYNHESFAIEYLREADPRAWPEPRRVAGRELLSLFHRLLLTVAALGAVGLAWYRRNRRVPWAAQTSVFVVVCALAIRGFTDDLHPFFWLAVLTPLVALLHLPGRPRQGPVGRTLLGLLVITSATHALFFGDDRYHLVVAPALCLLAAAALRKPLQPAERPATPAPVTPVG
jgi:4-amino-4-deoxy-L-arabinose transferase-like glycosyltransferase